MGGNRHARHGCVFGREPEPGEVDEWIEFMKILLKDVQCGERYVYFDGYVIPVTADGVNIEGWHSHHQLDFVPQIAALADSEIRDGLLCSTRVLAVQPGREGRRLTPALQRTPPTPASSSR